MYENTESTENKSTFVIVICSSRSSLKELCWIVLNIHVQAINNYNIGTVTIQSAIENCEKMVYKMKAKLRECRQFNSCPLIFRRIQIISSLFKIINYNTVTLVEGMKKKLY